MNIVSYPTNYTTYPSREQKPRKQAFCSSLLSTKDLKSYTAIRAEKNIKEQHNKEKARAQVIGIRACIVGLCATIIYFLFR